MEEKTLPTRQIPKSTLSSMGTLYETFGNGANNWNSLNRPGYFRLLNQVISNNFNVKFPLTIR